MKKILELHRSQAVCVSQLLHVGFHSFFQMVKGVSSVNEGLVMLCLSDIFHLVVLVYCLKASSGKNVRKISCLIIGWKRDIATKWLDDGEKEVKWRPNSFSSDAYPRAVRWAFRMQIKYRQTIVKQNPRLEENGALHLQILTEWRHKQRREIHEMLSK